MGVGVGVGLGVGVGVGLGAGVGVGVGEAALQSLNGELLLRGFGVTVEKSPALSFVSMQPLLFLSAAFVLLSADTPAAPSKQVALPYPTKSRALAFQVLQSMPLKGVISATRATFASVADKFAEPKASAVGRSFPLAAPASWTR